MATEPAKPSLRIVDLEAEIVAEILGYVNDESPKTTSALTLVSKYFYSAVKLVRYYRTTLNWSDDHTSWIVQANVDCKDPELLQRVRILTVGPRLAKLRKTQPVADDELVDILSKASNIKVLIWKPALPPSAGTIEALEKYHPKAQLRISRITIPQLASHSDPQRTTLTAAALLKTTCLRTLGIRRQGSGEEIGSLDYRILISESPNLEFVSVISDHSETAPADDSYSAGRNKLRHLTLDGWELSQDTVNYWSKHIDLSSLESFKCSRGFLSPSYFRCAADLLPGLRHVSLNLSPRESSKETAEAVQTYISSCSPLTKLSLWSWIGKVSLETILKQHGSTLESLQLHEREEVGDPKGPKVMSLDDIRSIRASCPNLRSFTFDLKRLSKQPRIDDYRPILEELVKMNLNALEIYLDSGLLFKHVVNDAADSSDDEDEDGEDDQEDTQEVSSTAAVLSNSRDSAMRALKSCGGAFDSSGLDPIKLKHVQHQYIFNRDHTEDPGQIELHPPTSADDICTFTSEMWKFVFGTRVSGARVLDLKFGEWERNSLPLLTDPYGEPYEDLRVWTRSKPHERDDKAGQCFAEMKCCQGRHWKKWTTY